MPIPVSTTESSKAIKNYGHKLKGNAAYFELHKAAQMGSELEVLCEEAQTRNDPELEGQAHRLAEQLLSHLNQQ